MTEERLNVPDVSCGHCKGAIEGALQGLAGIEDASVDLEAKAVRVTFDETVVDRTSVVRAIEAAGYPVAG